MAGDVEGLHHEHEESESPGKLVLLVIGLIIFHVGAFVSLKIPHDSLHN